MRGPNFLIIGAARSGSTSLAHCLAAHPAVYMPSGQTEPKFFSREQEFARGNDYYLNTYFHDADRFRAAGEKSTEYMENRSTAERIFRFNPAIKLISILRHPVDRVVSNYWWSVHNGVEDRPVDEALRRELDNYRLNPDPITALTGARPCAYIDRSLYYDNLAGYYALFRSNQIRCILYESFIKNQQAIFDDLCEFLDVPKLQLASSQLAPQRSVDRKATVDPFLYDELWHFFEERNRRLPELIGLDVWLLWHARRG